MKGIDECDWITNPDSRDVPDFDEDGFLRNPQQWSETIARCIALRDGVGELTQAHWDIIRTLRVEYSKHESPFALRYLCHIIHKQKNCVGDLFNNNGSEAWRIAGLPNPGEEAKAYL